MPWISKIDLAIPQQRREAGRNAFLIGAPGANRDHLGAVDRGGEVGCHTLDRNKAARLDVETATRADGGKAAVIEIGQPQPATERAQFGGKIDAADAGANDRDRCVSHRCVSRPAGLAPECAHTVRMGATGLRTACRTG